VKEYVAGGDYPYITLYYHSFDGEQGMVKTNACTPRNYTCRDVISHKSSYCAHLAEIWQLQEVNLKFEQVDIFSPVVLIPMS
jgi:hypothetical protein